MSHERCSQKDYRLVVTRSPNGRIGIESFDSALPRYTFRCAGCGSVHHATLEVAIRMGWVDVLDLDVEGLKPLTSLRFGTAEVLPDGPRTPYVERVPHMGRS